LFIFKLKFAKELADSAYNGTFDFVIKAPIDSFYGIFKLCANFFLDIHLNIEKYPMPSMLDSWGLGKSIFEEMFLLFSESSIFYYTLNNIIVETSKNLLDSIIKDDIMYFLQKRLELISTIYSRILPNGDPSLADPFFLIKEGGGCGPAGCKV